MLVYYCYETHKEDFDKVGIWGDISAENFRDFISTLEFKYLTKEQGKAFGEIQVLSVKEIIYLNKDKCANIPPSLEDVTLLLEEY